MNHKDLTLKLDALANTAAIDALEAEPVARVTGYYAGYLSVATVDGRVLPTGTALYTAPPEPSVPDMPLSMEQFGGLVGLARDDVSEKAIVYKATNIYGETCYFGVKATAQAWAKSGSVDEVRLRDLRVVATPAPPEPPADVARDAERYRWLLKQAWFQQAADRFDLPDGGLQNRFEKCMDEFIDAGMSEKGQS